MAKQLEFRARQRHPYFYVGATFGLIFVATGVMGIAAAPGSTTNDIVGAFALCFGAAILVSASYVLRGRLRVEASDDGWCTVTWILGRWSRSRRFPLAEVRNVRRCKPSASAIMWPPIAGVLLRVELQRQRRPIDIGGGFELDEASLQAIEDALRSTGEP